MKKLLLFTIAIFLFGGVMAQFPVTMNVDMSELEGFDPETHSVYVSGSIFGWPEPGTNEDVKLTQVDETLFYTITAEMEEPGEIQYKYFSDAVSPGWDGGEWAGDPNRKVFAVGQAVLADVWADQPFEVTFNVDMTDASGFDPEVHEVYMAGTINVANNWQEPGTDPSLMMTPSGDNPLVYTLTKMLYEGSYQYKYFSTFVGAGWDGGEWPGDPNREVSVMDEVTFNDVWAVQPGIDIDGTWKIAYEAGAIGVGPGQGDISWWSNSVEDLTTRACYFDDEYVFGVDGAFMNVLGEETWVEEWQGNDPPGCAAPVAPHDASNPATWEFDQSAGTLTLNGVGAFLGLPKVFNGGELTSPDDAPESITYIVQFSEGDTRMTVDIEIAGGWWRFVFDKVMPGPTARVQVIHNSADAAAAVVDVWLNDVLLLDNFAFRTASPFIDAPAGEEFTIAIKGPDSEDPTNPIWSQTYTLEDGKTYILVANGIVSEVGYDPAVPFDIYVYDMGREAAAAGNVDVLVFHGATDAPTVSVYEVSDDPTLLVDSFEYGTFAGYLELPIADYSIQIRNEAGDAEVATYSAPLATLGIDGAALTLVASGFLAPGDNSDGPLFGLYAALATGGALVELPFLSSIDEISSSTPAMNIYPNPAQNFLNIELLKEASKIEVFNVIGESIMTVDQVTSEVMTINTSSWSNGIYFITIHTTSGVQTAKFMKN